MTKDQIDVLLALRDLIAQKRLVTSQERPMADEYAQGFEEALAWVRGSIDTMIGVA